MQYLFILQTIHSTKCNLNYPYHTNRFWLKSEGETFVKNGFRLVSIKMHCFDFTRAEGKRINDDPDNETFLVIGLKFKKKLRYCKYCTATTPYAFVRFS